MNLYLHCLSCLTTSFLLSSKDIRPFLLSKSRGATWCMNGKTYGHTYQSISANHLEAELNCTICTIWLWDKLNCCLHTCQAQSHEVQSHVMFCFVKALRWWGVTRSAQPHVHTYVHALSLCQLYPLPFTWRISTNENFQKILLLLMQLFSQLYT
jgi:hypothetical protein